MGKIDNFSRKLLSSKNSLNEIFCRARKEKEDLTYIAVIAVSRSPGRSKGKATQSGSIAWAKLSLLTVSSGEYETINKEE